MGAFLLRLPRSLAPLVLALRFGGRLALHGAEAAKPWARCREEAFETRLVEASSFAPSGYGGRRLLAPRSKAVALAGWRPMH
jgi:hypothetical protein